MFWNIFISGGNWQSDWSWLSASNIMMSCQSSCCSVTASFFWQFWPMYHILKRVWLWIQLNFWVVISGKQARFRSSEGRLYCMTILKAALQSREVILYDKSKGSIAKHAAFVDSVIHIRCVWLSTWVLAACITELQNVVFSQCWQVLYHYDLDIYKINVALNRRMLITLPSARCTQRKIW